MLQLIVIDCDQPAPALYANGAASRYGFVRSLVKVSQRKPPEGIYSTRHAGTVTDNIHVKYSKQSLM